VNFLTKKYAISMEFMGEANKHMLLTVVTIVSVKGLRNSLRTEGGPHEEVVSGDLVVDEESTMSVTTNLISKEEMSIHSSPMYFLPTTKFFLSAIR
jgi:hypothetical protein